MTIKHAPRGALARCYVGLQDDFKTPFTGAQQELSFYGETIDRRNELATDPELGGARANGRDKTDPGPGLPVVAGGLTLPLDYNQMLWWLYATFGQPSISTDEGGGDYTHTFVSGAANAAFFTADFLLRSDHIKSVHGLAVNELTFGTDKTEGYRQITANIVGRDVVAALAALTGASQTAIPARAKSAGSIGVIRIDDVEAGPHVGGAFTYRNNFAPVQLADNSPLVGQMDPGDSYFGGSNTRFRMQSGAGADAIIAKFDDETTPFKFELDYTKAANQSLVITAPRCFGSKIIPQAGNGAAMEYEGSFEAYQTAAAPAVTVVLKNQTPLTAIEL